MLCCGTAWERVDAARAPVIALCMMAWSCSCVTDNMGGVRSLEPEAMSA